MFIVPAVELLIVGDPLTVNVLPAAPKAVALLIFSVPPDKATPPVVNVLAAASVNTPAEDATPPVPEITPFNIIVPAPDLVSVKPAVAIVPPIVKVLAATLTGAAPPSVTAPVPRFKVFVPVNVKPLLKVFGFVFAIVIAPVEASMVGVPPKVNLLAFAPKAVVLFMFKVPPPVNAIPPVFVFAPLSDKTPVLLAFTVSKPAPAKIPP